MLESKIGRQCVGDIYFKVTNQGRILGPLRISPPHDDFIFRASAVHNEWEYDLRHLRSWLAGLADDRPLVFTHADLDLSSILISP